MRLVLRWTLSAVPQQRSADRLRPVGSAALRRQKAIPFPEDSLWGTLWTVLPRWQVDRIPVERIGPVRDLRPAVSGTGQEVSDLQQRRRTSALEQERWRNLLRVVGQQADGDASEVVVGWSVARNRDSGGLVSRSHFRRPLAWPLQAAIRRIFGWPAVPGQSRRGRRLGPTHYGNLQLETQTLSLATGTYGTRSRW